MSDYFQDREKNISTVISSEDRPKTLAARMWNYVTDRQYSASVTSAWVFYTPLIAPFELASGYINKVARGQTPKSAFWTSVQETALSRATTMLVMAAAFKPMRNLRAKIAKKMDLTRYSPEFDKAKAAMFAMALMQPPFYSVSLLAVQMAKHSLTWEQYTIKLAGVVAIGVLSAFHYNRFADLWGDKHFGLESPLYDYDKSINTYWATITGKGIRKKQPAPQ